MKDFPPRGKQALVATKLYLSTLSMICPSFNYRVTDNSGTRLSTSGHVERISDLYIGKAASSQKFAKFQMMSLAVWQRALSSDEVNDVYFAGRKAFLGLFINVSRVGPVV